MSLSNSVSEHQKLVAKVVKELGFDNETIPEVFMLLNEEVGELAKAIRKHATDIKTHKDSKTHQIDEELADVYWYLLDLCNMTGVDLRKALEMKVQKNAKRKWL